MELGAIVRRPATFSSASTRRMPAYPTRICGWPLLSRATIWSTGKVAGALMTRIMPPPMMADPAPVAWMAVGAHTTPIVSPPCGDPPAASSRAMLGRRIARFMSASASQLRTNTPRLPELPPEARQRYSPANSSGCSPIVARCPSTAARVSLRSVTTSSKCSIRRAFVITGSDDRSSSPKRSGSTPASRRAWKGAC